MSIHRVLLCTATFLLGSVLHNSHAFEYFDLSDVRLTSGPFYRAQQTDLAYILELEVDRLLAPFQEAAGITPLKPKYPNWEGTGLGGHIGGHYLSALSLMYAATGTSELSDRLDYMLEKLEECQTGNGNGYVGGVDKKLWQDVSRGSITVANNFDLNGGWVPLYNIHKLFAGLRDAYLIGKKEKALEILISLTEWFYQTTKNLSFDKCQTMCNSEHGGINEVFADVAVLADEEKYLEMANRFSHRIILDPLLKNRNDLTGKHANTQIPKVIGFKRYADVVQNADWDRAAAYFWDLIVNEWTIAIGGNSVSEHLHNPNDFSSMVSSKEGPETCNTYNMLRLTRMLYKTEQLPKYMNYYERAIYNHILSSQNSEKGGFVYFTSMRPRHYRVYSTPSQCMWCCVGSGMENHGKYGEMIYARDGGDLFVNLFIPSTLAWNEKGLHLQQKTDFPYEEQSQCILELGAAKIFKIKIRKPLWVDSTRFQILVNNVEQKITVANQAYVSLSREWSDGDTITVRLPMKTTLEYLPDGSNYAAFVRGPVVLAAATGSDNMTGLWANSDRMGHIANGKEYSLNDGPWLYENVDPHRLQPKQETPMAFLNSDNIATEQFKGLILQPFFEIHEARYIVYWPIGKEKVAVNSPRVLPDRQNDLPAMFICNDGVFFTVPAASNDIRIDIFSVDGRCSATLYKHSGMGGNKIKWNTGNVAAGIYYYRYRQRNNMQTGTILKQ